MNDLFLTRRYNGSDLTPIEPKIYMPPEFVDWASDEFRQLEEKGCMARCDQVAGENEPRHPKMRLLLQVEPNILERRMAQSHVPLPMSSDGRRGDRPVPKAKRAPSHARLYLRLYKSCCTPTLGHTIWQGA